MQELALDVRLQGMKTIALWRFMPAALAAVLGMSGCGEQSGRSRALFSFTQEVAQNRRVWDQLRPTIRQKYRGQFIGIANGELLAHGKIFEDVEADLRRRAPGARHLAICRAESEPIWSITYRY